MAPKVKRKAKAKDAVAPATASDLNALQFNMHPVKPVVPTDADDPAARIRQLDAAIETAKIGIGKINLLKIVNALTFGVYNDRAEKTSEVNKMVTSFETHGIQAFTEINALPMMIQRSRLSPDQMFDGDWNKRDSLTEVGFNDTEAIVMASGQHRVAALRKMHKSYLDDEITLSKRLNQLRNLKATEELLQEHAAPQRGVGSDPIRYR
ncbi:hypothetical protein BDR05DRAFT_996032 [Suillus weaverae]|nr:hypothetical protein BDR05DRAFT_996032 [Suillus weaverae]